MFLYMSFFDLLYVYIYMLLQHTCWYVSLQIHIYTNVIDDMCTYVYLYVHTVRLASYEPPTMSPRYLKPSLTLQIKGIAQSQVSCRP